MAAYFNEPDHTAHSNGPNSTQVKFTYIRIGIVLLLSINYSLVAIRFGSHYMWLIIFVMFNDV